MSFHLAGCGQPDQAVIFQLKGRISFEGIGPPKPAQCHVYLYDTQAINAFQSAVGERLEQAKARMRAAEPDEQSFEKAIAGMESRIAGLAARVKEMERRTTFAREARDERASELEALIKRETARYNTERWISNQYKPAEWLAKAGVPALQAQVDSLNAQVQQLEAKLLSEQQTAGEETRKLKEQISAQQRERDALTARYALSANPFDYLPVLGDPLQKTTADEDGRFQFDVSECRRYVLVAYAEQAKAEPDGPLFWMAWIEPFQGEYPRIPLTDGNRLPKDVPQCFLNLGSISLR